jgi:iron complex transport system substrate-binding protein
MRTWWILPAVAAIWIGLGCILWRPHHADAGSALRPAQAPTRIVSMAPELTEILFSLGLEDNIAGVTQDSDYPPAAAGKRTLGTFWQPDIEAVVALKPDLVVALGFEPQKSLAGRLTRMGYRCLMLDIWTVDDLFHAIGTLGQVTGRQPRAQQLRDTMRARLASIQNATAGRDKVKVLWVVQRDPLRVAGRNTFINELIELAGGENAIGTTIHKYPAVGGEQVIASAPQVIIEPTMTRADLREQRAQAVSYWRRFKTVPAVAGGRIYVIDGDLVSRLGPRLCDGVEAVARCLWPEAFGE